MKAWHLSDSQIKRLFEHFMIKESKMLNYISFAKAIAGPPNLNRLKQARDVLSSLASKQSKTVTKILGNKQMTGDDSGVKMAPIF